MGWLAALLLTGQVYWCDVDGERRMQNWPCDEDQPRTTAEAPAEPQPARATAPRERPALVNLSIRSHCREIRESTGSYQVEQACVEGEQEARSELRSMSIPPEILAHCNEIGQRTGSYQVLQACVGGEIEAKRALP
ncbi:hypothetical protein [Wenzhouxiangella sediminis]|uniref:Uncharacterized protein n=1 Tax=Wenzhouxiangella sediminis TaxID=1792836 RepID=A0A3E1K5D8_9GAMM|nr:hypothetical protein [Wenzhouxiangella sediminis]RFF29229.1 hypothetical protein DZC52_14080 [Wenzhouxiangella sediminis]